MNDETKKLLESLANRFAGKSDEAYSDSKEFSDKPYRDVCIGKGRAFAEAVFTIQQLIRYEAVTGDDAPILILDDRPNDPGETP